MAASCGGDQHELHRLQHASRGSIAISGVIHGAISRVRNVNSGGGGDDDDDDDDDDEDEDDTDNTQNTRQHMMMQCEA